MDKDGYVYQYADKASAERIVIPLPPTWGLATTCDEFLELGVCKAHKNHVLRFQEDGVRWMVVNPKNILLADEMGLGKTLEILLFINVTQPKKILIVCPNNAKITWKRHFEMLAVSPYEIEMVSTTLCMGLGDVLIANYEAVTKWDASLRLVDWDLVVFDEGHKLKNPSAKRSKACYSIHGKKSIIVTGSPIVNYPYEVFPLIHYLDKENHPSASRHETLYGSRGNARFGYNLNRLNSILRSTIMLRRHKKDVLTELPKKRQQLIEFEVDDATRLLIEEEKRLWNLATGSKNDAAQLQLVAAMANESDVAMEEIDWQSIIESLTTTKRYAFTEMSRISHLIGLAKVPYAIDHIENLLESKEKVIVFGHHRDVLTNIYKHFGSASSVLLLGGGGADQPQKIWDASDRFNNDDSCSLFLGGISIAESYSLRNSSTIVFIEQSWIPGEFSQAIDRAHGIGRGDAEAKSLMIYYLVFEDSLDTKKAQLNIRKQKSIDRAMNR